MSTVLKMVEHSRIHRCCSSAGSGIQCLVDHLLRFAHDRMQVRLAFEAFGIDFVDVLRPGGPGRKPAAFRYDFQPAKRSLIPLSPCQLGGNGFARQVRLLDRIG